MEKLTDVVYALGNGSAWNNNEIRFSLRGLEKNGINCGKIFIVGVFPDFLSGKIIHIPAEDIYNPTVNADGNIARKVLAACADKRLSHDFLFINDDHVILKPVDLKAIPSFHKGDMNSYPDKYWSANQWRCRLKKTREILNQRGLTALHFDCHTPIMLNKKVFPKVMAEFPIFEGIGLTMKSLYGNCVCTGSCKLLDEEKKTVFTGLTLDQITKKLSGCCYMSFNDSGLNNSLKSWLYHQFPDRSRWETTDPDDRTLEILKWVDGDRDFTQGVRLFEKYLHGVNLLQMFRKGENEILRKKLEYKLIDAITGL